MLLPESESSQARCKIIHSCNQSEADQVFQWCFASHWPLAISYEGDLVVFVQKKVATLPPIPGAKNNQ